MTNQDLQNPANVASVDETVDRVKNTRLDLFGGPKGAVILGVLFVLIGLIDTLGLGPIMSSGMMSDPMDPFYFREFCTAPPASGVLPDQGPSGGYAIGFVGVLLVAMAALQTVAPRSVRWGFGFFVLTVIGLQVYVAYRVDVADIAQSLPLSQVLSTGWADRLSCVGATTLSEAPRTIFNWRYNPETISGAEVGIPVQFTTMLAFNWLLLAGFALAALLAAVVASIVRIFRKPAVEKGPIGGLFGFFARGPVERSIIVLMASLTILGVMAGPFLVMMFAGQGGSSVFNFTESTHNLVWVGAVVFLADLARVALWSPEPEAEVGLEKAPEQKEPDLFLHEVLSGLKDQFGGQISHSFTLDPLPNAKRVPMTVAASDFEDGEDIPPPGQGNLHFETLTHWHYDLIVEVMNRRVFDRGRTAIMVCPVDVIESVKAALTAGFAQNPGHNVVNWWCYGDRLPEDDHLDLILVTPETLEALVAEVFSYREFFWLLGGVFVLNLHRMDLGLLHVSLKRLERYVRSPGDMVAILQSEYRRWMGQWSQNLPLLVKVSNIRQRQRPEVNEAIPQHVAFLDAKTSEGFADGRANWPVGLKALIHTSKTERRALPYAFDTHSRHNRSFWDNTIIQSLRNDGEETTLAWARDFRAPALVPEQHGHPVGLLTDSSNLVNSLGSDIGTPGALEALRLVTVGGYPGAQFLADRIKDALAKSGTAKDRRHAIDALKDSYGSITPAPSGGPIEIALMIRQEFMSATRARVGQRMVDEGYTTLTQERIGTFWDKESPALRQLRISNTKAGLEKLFRITLQPQSTGEMLHGEQTEHRSYEYTLTERATRNIDALAMLELSIQDPQAAGSGAGRPERLLLSDHGLSYAKGTRITLGGRIYEVDAVESPKRRLQVSYSEDRPAAPYSYVRDYGILTEGQDESGFAADGTRAWLTRKAPHETAIGYLQAARRTRAVFEHATAHKPFDGPNTEPSRTDVDATSKLQLRSAMILRVLANDGGSAQGRGGARRGRVQRGGEHVSGAMAFTLATTLQDVLHMCFPANAHRIAVLSPQSACEDQRGSIEQFARQRQPSLQLLDPAQQKVAERKRGATDHGLEPKFIASHAKLAGAFFDRARAEQRVPGHEKTTLMHLFIIEDSDHDIGVAKALFREDVFSSVLTFWRDYVAHCAETKEAYAFGARRVASCYDFDAALTTLNDMIAEDN